MVASSAGGGSWAHLRARDADPGHPVRFGLLFQASRGSSSLALLKLRQRERE